MTTETTKTRTDVTGPEEQARARRSLDLTRRFTQAAMADPSILDGVPNGVTLVLLPAEEPERWDEEIELGLMAVRQGRDILIKHVRLADLPA